MNNTVSEDQDEGDNFKLFSEKLKEQGNEAFQSNDLETAINYYSQAIDIDPDNHVLYSNRSAAYLKNDNKSKALYDAEKCVSLNPTWSKGYSRLGASQQALKRFDDAKETIKKGIELDPNNQALWSALRSCQEAFENDKKQRFAAAAIERAQDEERIRLQEEAFLAAKKKKEESKPKEEDLLSTFFSEVISNDVPKKESADDDLSSFFAEVSADTSVPVDVIQTPLKDENTLTEKYFNQDLGDGPSQIMRLTSTNYQWKNLNPYFVMQLDIDATEEDIRFRYKKLSTKVHPDKMRDIENAREAFEELKSAYQKLLDPDQKKVIIAHIEQVKSDFFKERKKLLSKGMNESELPTVEEGLQKAAMAHFAEIEMSRRRSEKNLRVYNARDRMAEDKEKEKLIKERDFEINWSEGDRQDKRVGNWREFQTVPEAKKQKMSSYKEEHSAQSKKVAVGKVETWKKNWK